MTAAVLVLVRRFSFEAVVAAVVSPAAQKEALHIHHLLGQASSFAASNRHLPDRLHKAPPPPCSQITTHKAHM
jgi:hypothetical protein